jgi:hypothetical protein
VSRRYGGAKLTTGCDLLLAPAARRRAWVTRRKPRGRDLKSSLGYAAIILALGIAIALVVFVGRI